jgi:hypothetical protein
MVGEGPFLCEFETEAGTSINYPTVECFTIIAGGSMRYSGVICPGYSFANVMSLPPIRGNKARIDQVITTARKTPVL